MPKNRFFVFVAVSVLIGIMSGLLLAEIGLRLWGPSWLKQRMKEVGVKNSTGIDPAYLDSDKYWPVERRDGKFLSYVPFSEFDVLHYEYKNKAHIDEWGGRRVEPPDFLRSNTLIFFLGDSFTFGVGVEDFETWVSILGKKLGYRFENLGTPGSCLLNNLDLLELRHEDLGQPPLYCFSVFVGNDFIKLIDQPVFQKNSDQLSKTGILTRIVESGNNFVRLNPFLRKVFLIQFLKSKMLAQYNKYLLSRGGTLRLDDDIFRTISPGVKFDKMAESFDLELAGLLTLSKKFNFRPLFIVIPDRHQIDDVLLSNKLKFYNLKPSSVDSSLPNRMLKEKFEKYHLPSIDPLNCLRDSFKKSETKRYYYVLDNHFTKDGQQAFAACIEKDLKNQLETLIKE